MQSERKLQGTTMLYTRYAGRHFARLLAACCCAWIMGCAVSRQEEPLATGTNDFGGSGGNVAQAATGAGHGVTGGTPGQGGSGTGGGPSMAGSITAAGGTSGENPVTGSAGSTVSGSAGSPGVAGNAACTPGMTLVGAPINDSEALNAQGNDYIQTTSSGWFVYYDEAHSGTVSPTKAMPQLGVVAGNGGSVFKVTGTALAADFWGVGAGIWISPCIDSTNLTGVKFWLKSDRSVVVSAMTPATTPISGGGTCTEPCVANSASLLPAKPQGEAMLLPLASFSGGSAPLDRAKLTGLIFTVNAPGGSAWSFDVQIDDVGVY